MKHEVLIGTLCFYLLGDMISGFGGVIGYGVSLLFPLGAGWLTILTPQPQQMDDLAGYSGWRWISIIEGTVTLVAVLG